MVPIPPSEEHLRAPVVHHLEEGGYDVHHEVRFNGRVADLLAVRGQEVVAVELKLTDWTGALVQARAYQVGARRTFVALPLPKALRLERRGRWPRFERAGVGLLGVPWPEGPVRELLPARASDRTLPFLREALTAGRLHRERKRPWRPFR